MPEEIRDEFDTTGFDGPHKCAREGCTNVVIGLRPWCSARCQAGATTSYARLWPASESVYPPRWVVMVLVVLGAALLWFVAKGRVA